VVLPLVIGLSVRRWAPGVAQPIQPMAGRLTQLLVCVVAFVAFSQSGGGHQQAQATQVVWALLLVVILFCLLTTAAAVLGRWQQWPVGVRKALLFTAPQKSLATGAPLLSALIAGAGAGGQLVPGLVLLPLMLYHPVQLLLGGLLATWLARHWPEAA
jgi:sodium/bile acid cotransporter 7